jgi:hypothetical protein
MTGEEGWGTVTSEGVALHWFTRRSKIAIISMVTSEEVIL